MKTASWCGIPACVCLLAGLAAGQERHDWQFVHGLVERRLFDLAAIECQRQLAAVDLAFPARVDWTVELMRILAQRAIHAPPAGREPHWQAAHDVAERFLTEFDSESRRVLVLVQDALTRLAQGELARMEAEVAVDPQAALGHARQTIHQAARALEDYDRLLIQQIARAAAETAAGSELGSAELFALQNHVRFELARALRNQALCYPPDSDDHLAALSLALEQLKRTLSQLQSDDPLAWRAYLDLATCHRLLGSFDLALHTLVAPLSSSAPPEIRQRAIAESALVTIAQGQPLQALTALREAREQTTTALAELDFAYLQAVLALWQTAAEAKQEAEGRKWQAEAAATVAGIERTHGTYWGRRAALQLLSVADSGTAPGNAEILGRAADELYAKEQFAEAIVAYERGANQARATRDLTAAWQLEQKAAAIEQQLEQFDAASQRLERLALEQSDPGSAARNHLLAAWNAAQDTRLHTEKGPRYERLLETHLERWPEEPTSQQARLWLGRWHERQQRWEQAARAYQGISPEAEQFPVAVESLARCWRQLLARRAADDETADELLANALQYLDALILDTQGQWPATWSSAQRSAAMATAALRIDHLRSGYTDAQRVLQAALWGTPDPTVSWREEAQSLLVIALAGQPSQLDQARALLEEVRTETPQRLPEIVQRLARLAQHHPDMATALAPLQLAAIEAFAADPLPLEGQQQLQIDQARAAALSAAGRSDESIEILQRLAQTHPDHATIQLELARALTARSDAPSLSRAIVQWQQIARRLRPDTPAWYEAKYGLALALYQRNQTNDRSVASQQLRYLKVTSQVDQSPWSKDVDELLQRCERE